MSNPCSVLVSYLFQDVLLSLQLAEKGFLEYLYSDISILKQPLSTTGQAVLGSSSDHPAA